jgi:arginase family enzyme
MLNSRAIVDYSARLADTVGQVLGAGQFPIVLGGDCSVLLGSMLALNRRGRYGLLFPDTAARQAVAYLEEQKTRGFWIHLDADVLDDAIMSAVDYRLANGLTWIVTEAVLRIALKSGIAVGLELTILNPKLDKDGDAVRLFVDMLARALTF